MTEVSNDVIEVKADGQLFAPPLDVSALSEQEILDLVRRLDRTRGDQQAIDKLLGKVQDHLGAAVGLIEDATWNYARDPGQKMRLKDCRELVFTLDQKIQEAREPDGGPVPMERYGLH